MPVRSDKPPECPRCGYDLRGTVATWTEACPLEGMCNECGLDIDWSRVFHLAEHPWSFEYHWRRRPIRCALATLGLWLRPWRLWTKVQLEDRFHIWPTAVLVLLALVVWCLAYAIIVVARMGLIATIWRLSLSELFATHVRIPLVHGWREGGLILGFMLLWSLTTAASFILLPISMRRARVMPRHIVRIALYGTPWAVGTVLAILLGDVLARAVMRFLSLPTLPSPWIAIGCLALAAAAALAAWYGLAIRRYLRMERAWTIALLLTIVGGLFTIVAHVTWYIYLGL